MTITYRSRIYYATTLEELEQIAAEVALIALQARLVIPAKAEVA